MTASRARNNRFICCRLVKFDGNLFIILQYSSIQYLNETMGQTSDDVYMSSYMIVAILGIFGNILVITSILRRRKLLKNNYYFLVLHLSICDLTWLVIDLSYAIHHLFIKEWLFKISIMNCLVRYIKHVFKFVEIYMMLIIAMLRYHAAVHPLKHDITRRKLKVICRLGYILGLIVQCGTSIPECFLQKNVVDYVKKYVYAYVVLLLYFGPTSIMAVLYYKVYGALEKQNKYLKSLHLTPAEKSLSSSFKMTRYIRNRRTFLVCLAIVLCYAFGNLFMSLRLILKINESDNVLMENIWVTYFAFILRVALTTSVNPLIYGILDKTLCPFTRCCKKKQI